MQIQDPINAQADFINAQIDFMNKQTHQQLQTLPPHERNQPPAQERETHVVRVDGRELCGFANDHPQTEDNQNGHKHINGVMEATLPFSRLSSPTRMMR